MNRLQTFFYFYTLQYVLVHFSLSHHLFILSLSFPPLPQAKRAEEMKGASQEPISVSLPDGKVIPDCVAWKTTPMDVANAISKGLAQNALVAKVAYSSRVKAPFEGEVVADDGMEVDESLSVGGATGGASAGELWDMNRPLEGSCVVSGAFLVWEYHSCVYSEELYSFIFFR